MLDKLSSLKAAVVVSSAIIGFNSLLAWFIQFVGFSSEQTSALFGLGAIIGALFLVLSIRRLVVELPCAVVKIALLVLLLAELALAMTRTYRLFTGNAVPDYLLRLNVGFGSGAYFFLWLALMGYVGQRSIGQNKPKEKNEHPKENRYPRR